MSTSPEPATAGTAAPAKSKPGKAVPGKALDVDLLPDVTSDEMREEDSRDDWLRGEVPPHHGG